MVRVRSPKLDLLEVEEGVLTKLDLLEVESGLTPRSPDSRVDLLQADLT